MPLHPYSAHAQTNLWMAEQSDCRFCAQWENEVGSIYPKTKEGQLAPLKKAHYLALPVEVSFKQPVHFTPTFILVRDNQEIGRIEGYRNDEQFWMLIYELFQSKAFTK